MPDDPVDPNKSDVISAIAAPGVPPGQAVTSTLLGSHVQVAIGPATPSHDVLLDKLTDQHLASVIEQSRQDSQQKHDERLWAMKLIAFVLVVTFLMIGALSWLFLSYQKTESLEKILNIVFGVASGGLGGFGIGRATAPKPKK